MLKLLISIVLLLNAQQGYCLKCHTYQCGTMPATTLAPAVVTTAAPAVKAAAAGDSTCPANITLDKLGTEDCKAPYDSCVIKTMTSEPSKATMYTIYGCTEYAKMCEPDNNAKVDCQKCKTDLCNPQLPVLTTIVTNTGSTGSGGGTNKTEGDKGKAGGSAGQHHPAGAAAGFLAVLLAFCF